MMSKGVSEKGGQYRSDLLKEVGEKAQKKIPRVYMSFRDLEKAYHRVNREAL